MALPNIFNQDVAEQVIQRIENLQPESAPSWGKMNAAQMLAHCNVTYEMVYEDKHPAPNFFMGLMLKGFVKKYVVSEIPYRHDLKTAPAFIIHGTRNFEAEKKRLIDHIRKTQQLGASYFEGKKSLSFGVLSATEWNNMFYKHLDHHLGQFGV